jgi:hypothetical protein
MSLIKDPHDLNNLFDRRFGKAFRKCDRTDVAILGRDIQDGATGKALDLALVVVIGVG